MKNCRVIAGALSISACSGAWAWPTVLNVMPTADVLGHKEIYVGYGFIGLEQNISKDITHFAGAQVGLFDRVEFGFDHDLEGTGVSNIKANLYADKKLSIAAGLMNIGDGETQKYAAASWTLDESSRIHFGWLDDGIHRWMAGYELAFNDQWSLLVDSISGSDSYTNIGVNWLIPTLPGFDLTVAAGIPHDRSNGYSYTVTFAYSSRL